MNIKYTQILTISILAVLLAGGSFKWWESSQIYDTTVQESHPTSKLNIEQGLQTPVIKTDKKDRYQELESKLAKLEALYHASATANISNIKKHQEFTVSEGDGGFDDDDIEQQTQARAAEVQRLAEQRDTYFAQIEEQHRMQEVDTQWASAIEQNMWVSYKQPDMDKATAINDIDCRTDMCIIDITQSASGTEDTSAQSQDVFNWVSANAGACEFAISESSADENPEVEALQKVYLTNCRQT